MSESSNQTQKGGEEKCPTSAPLIQDESATVLGNAAAESNPPASGTPVKLQVGAVYRDSDDGNLYIPITAEKDSQEDVQVLNFGGRIGYAHFEVCGDEKLADSLDQFLERELAAVAKERDEARSRADILCWNEGKCEGIAKGILRPFEFAPEGMEPPYPVLHAAEAVSKLAAQLAAAQAACAEMRAYIEALPISRNVVIDFDRFAEWQKRVLALAAKLT